MIWCAALAVGIGWALARGGPTAREQTTVGQAQPVVDRAVSDIAAAASADGLAVVAVSDFHRVGECSVTVLRPGERYQRELLAAVTPGTELALLERVASRLPTSYEAVVRAGTVPRLTAEAGFWVAVNGSLIAPGQVRFVADTGSCRPTSDIATSAAADGDRSAVQTVLTRLGLVANQWSTHRVACSGGLLTTVEARAAAGASSPGPLDDALRELGGSTVAASPVLYAYRTASAGVIVRADDDRVIVTATTACS